MNSALYCLFIATSVCLSCVSCGPTDDEKRREPPARAFQDYNEITLGFLELADRVKNLPGGKAGRPDSFKDLCDRLQKNFPDTQVSLESTNPFPTILPNRNYSVMRDWGAIKDSASIPFIWVTSHIQEDIIIYVSVSGEMQVAKPAEFKSTLAKLAKMGAKQEPRH